VLTAGYAMYLRIAAHGLTVSRFWGCVVLAAACRKAAGEVLARANRWDHSAHVGPSESLADMVVHPTGRALNQALADAIVKDLTPPAGG
jgi:hypothetical protein